MRRQRSVMQKDFGLQPKVSMPRSTFNRSHGHKTTFDGGYLVPILRDEVLPGDTLKCKMEGFARLSTPAFPVMDNMFLETFFFFVPLRLVWDNFNRFMGEQINPGDSTDFVTPKMTVPNGGYGEMSLQDYLGLPT